MWLTPDGRKFASPLKAPSELHGGMTDTGELVWLDVEGERVRVQRRGIRFVIYDEWAMGVCGSARCYEMSDGSYWIAARKLTGRVWLDRGTGGVTYSVGLSKSKNVG